MVVDVCYHIYDVKEEEIMGISGTDLLWKILGTGIFVWLIWIFIGGGIATVIALNNIPWYGYAGAIVLLFLIFMNKKR